MKPYYATPDGRAVLYHADCREVLPDLRADAVVTDPPYGIRKAAWDDRFDLGWSAAMPRTVEYLALLPGIWNLPECPRVIGRLEYQWMLAARLTNGMTRGCVGFGNWIACLLYCLPDRSLYVQDGDCREFAIGRSVMPDHPSPKPLGVMRWIVRRMPGDTILDPFCGSGTTLVAAWQLGRASIGVEIEERYCEVAAKRLEATVQQGMLDLTEPEQPTARQEVITL